jgi:peptide/nickel transport system permease protein
MIGIQRWWRQWRGSRPTTGLVRWARRGLYLLVLIALLGDFLANDKPLVAGYEGTTRFPIFHQYAVALGLQSADITTNRDWKQLKTDWAWWPLIPYAARNVDFRNQNFVSPFGEQQVDSWRFRHWLGTDQVGHDVAAGLISGTRIALAVGIVAMSLAALLGIFFGGLAGFFGNDRMRLSRSGVLGVILVFPLAVFYGFQAGGQSSGWGALGGVLLFLTLIASVTWLFDRLGRRWVWTRKPVRLPVDSLVMRLIEVINSVPGLFVLLAVAGMLDKPSLWIVMLIIGLISWTGIARFLRAELFKIRQQPFIDAARVQGFSESYILRKHALPNALGPVIVALAFGMAGAVLLEAFLSFLGIGLPRDVITWGSLLQSARDNPYAWWVAIFPGLAIFSTILIFNVLGEYWSER